jgi:cytochrome c5
VSKHDSAFITHFSIVIGSLVTITILLLALARTVAGRTQGLDVYKDPMYFATVKLSTAPFTQEAVAGQDNSAMAIQQAPAGPGAPAGAGTAVAMAVPKSGAELFQSVCSSCHGSGLAGAPKAGDKAAWAPRIAEGKATLYEHALNGFNGKAGVMPAKGGRADLPDDLIKQGVDYMVSLAQ